MKKVNTSHLLRSSTTTASKYIGTHYPRGPESASIEIPPFRPHFIKSSKTVYYELNLTSKHSHLEVLLLKVIHRQISSAYVFLIVDLRERGTLLQQLTYLFFNINFKCTSASVILEETGLF